MAFVSSVFCTSCSSLVHYVKVVLNSSGMYEQYIHIVSVLLRRDDLADHQVAVFWFLYRIVSVAKKLACMEKGGG